MAIVNTRVLSYDGTWRTLDGYCDVCKRLLCYGELMAGACWWCEPKTRPSDFEQHLEQIRKPARAKQSRGAKRPVQPTDDADEDDA
jgi:hypothetical protein